MTRLRFVLVVLTVLVSGWLVTPVTAQTQVWHWVNGVLRGPGFVTAGPVRNGDGSPSAPSYSFASDGADDGMYLSSANTLGFSASGAFRMLIGAGVTQLADSQVLAWSDISLSRGAANRLDLATGDSFSFAGTGGSLMFTAVPVITNTAPTVTSAGTSPSVSGTNTAAFRVNVGTGGTATTIVMAMPAATTGWNCNADNITAAAANRASVRVVQQSSTTTAVTVQNQNVATGAATAFTASDIVAFTCMAF